MQSNLPFILDRMRVNLAESGSPVVMQWKEITGGTLDPVTGSRLGATTVTRTETIRAFVHVTAATTSIRQHAEIQVGDAILDVDPDLDLSGKTDLRFQFNGEWWVQKEIGKDLAQQWDALVTGHRLMRTIVLRKAT